MATYPLHVSYFDASAIAAEQTSPTGNPYVFTSAFSTWVDSNMPMDFIVMSGAAYIDIPDWNTGVVADYLTNWYIAT